MYPTLSYEAGETDECIENTPNSYIYEFMKGLFFPEECRCEGFPEYPSLIVSEYCYIEDGGVLHWSSRHLCVMTTGMNTMSRNALALFMKWIFMKRERAAESILNY